MTSPEAPDAELMEIFGGTVQPIEPDPDEMSVTLTLQELRAQLVDAAKRDGVGVNQLARRLHVAPSSVSRALGDSGDMRVSTLVLYARALGRRWDFWLTHDADCHAAGNRPAALEMIFNIKNSTTIATPVFDLKPKSDNVLSIPPAYACL
jgi:transcriptional regulator with XRE-family HTH domain